MMTINRLIFMVFVKLKLYKFVPFVWDAAITRCADIWISSGTITYGKKKNKSKITNYEII